MVSTFTSHEIISIRICLRYDGNSAIQFDAIGDDVTLLPPFKVEWNLKNQFLQVVIANTGLFEKLCNFISQIIQAVQEPL